LKANQRRLTTETFFEKIGFKDRRKEETLWEQGKKCIQLQESRVLGLMKQSVEVQREMCDIKNAILNEHARNIELNTLIIDHKIALHELDSTYQIALEEKRQASEANQQMIAQIKAQL
jgi:hypothetical protein